MKTIPPQSEYQTVEDLCETVARLTETIKRQEAENAQLRALLAAYEEVSE